MKFTGERMIPEYNEGQEIYLEHITRYIFASQFVKDKVVLDIACGSGYGTNQLLESGAKKVFGIDISEEAISYCKEKYTNKELEFMVGDVKRIPLEDKSIDAVVSFETIEHVGEEDQKIFLKEVKRVLTPEGIFIVSTPNSLVYGKGNEFHLKELDPQEFAGILKSNFKNTELFYQDNVESSYVYSQEALEKVNDKLGISKKVETIKSIDSMYLVSVCSDFRLEEIKEYIGLSNIKPRDMWLDFIEKNKNKDEEIFKLNKDIQGKDEYIQSKINDINKKDQDIKQLNQEIQQKHQDVEERDNQINMLLNSTSWKITKPMRLIKDKILRTYNLFLCSKEIIKKEGIFVFFKKAKKRLFLYLNRKIFCLLEKKIYRKWDKYFLKINKNRNIKTILYVDRGIPEYDKDAGSFIAWEYLKIIKDLGYEVIFWPLDHKKTQPYYLKLKEKRIKVIIDQITPEWFVKNFGSKIDVTILSRPSGGLAFLYYLKKYTKSKIIYLGHDLHYLREKRSLLFDNKKNTSNYEETKKSEFYIMKESNISLFFSDKETEEIKKEDPKIKTEVSPWVEKISLSDEKIDFSSRFRVVFLGGFSHLPNLNGVLWFYDQIFPVLREKIPGFVFTIVGSNIPEKIKKMESRNFETLGHVAEEELAKIFNETKVFVAPLLFGAGFKGKIAKAISFGVPVVTTEIGAEGIGLKNNKTAMITDKPEEFADYIIKLFNDEVLWNKISQESIKLLKENYSYENAKKKLKKFVEN